MLKKGTPSNNLKKLLAVNLVIKSCLDNILNEHSDVLSSSEFNHYKSWSMIVNNTNDISVRKHSKKDLDSIYLIIKSYIDSRKDSKDLAPVGEVVDLLILSINKHKLEFFYGVKTIYKPLTNFTTNSVRVITDFVKTLDCEFNTKPNTDSINIPVAKKVKPKVKKTRTESQRKPTVNLITKKSKKVKKITSDNLPKTLKQLLPDNVTYVFDSTNSYLHLTMDMNDRDIEATLEVIFGSTMIMFKRDIKETLQEMVESCEAMDGIKDGR